MVVSEIRALSITALPTEVKYYLPDPIFISLHVVTREDTLVSPWYVQRDPSQTPLDNFLFFFAFFGLDVGVALSSDKKVARIAALLITAGANVHLTWSESFSPLA